MIILSMKFKKWLLPVFMGALSATALLSPSITQAVEETGTIAASKAADQKAALAKKAKALAEKKAAEALASFLLKDHSANEAGQMMREFLLR